MGVKIAILRRADTSALRDVRVLLTQVYSNFSKRSGTISELRNLVSDKNTAVIVAKDGTRIIGMALLYIIANVGRRIGHVEAVVVDGNYRGKGLGKSLMRELIKTARKKKLARLYLTSRPARVAANALYQKIGFEKKETDAYCLKL